MKIRHKHRVYTAFVMKRAYITSELQENT